MTDSTDASPPDPSAQPDPAAQPDPSAEPQTPDPHAGLSATGRTADQMHPGQAGPGTTYGDPGGTGTAGEEVAGEGGSDEPT